MSTSCCQRSSSLSTKVRAQLTQKLEGIRDMLVVEDVGDDENENSGNETERDVDGINVDVSCENATWRKAQLEPEVCCICTTESVLASCGNWPLPDAAPETFAPVLGSLRVSAVRFANTLQVTECPTLHVKGTSHLFSCYTVGEHYFAMYMTGKGNMDLLNTTELDELLRPKLEDLQLFLRNIE